MQTQIPAQQAKQNQPRTEHKFAEFQSSGFQDARPELASQLHTQSLMANSARTTQLKSTQAMMAANTPAKKLGLSPGVINPIPLQRIEHEEPLQAKTNEPALREQSEASSLQKPNNTGLPDNLKTGIENLSGMSLDHVRVHYNSDKPAQLQAHAYAQGSEIHVAPGQEKHLPHEAWHLVQQAQGRVRPTMQMKGGVGVNDDVGLETEAYLMGAKATSEVQKVAQKVVLSTSFAPADSVAQRAELANDKLNVAGEKHGVSNGRRAHEAAYSTAITGGGYWREHEFKVSGVSNVSADDFALRAQQLIAFAKDANLGHWISINSDALVASLVKNEIDMTTFEMPLKLFRPDELEYYKDYIPVHVYNEYNETLLNKGDLFEKCINSIRGALSEYIKSSSPHWRGMLLEAVQLYQVVFAVLDLQIGNVMSALEIISSADVSLQRSRKMHAAANDRAGTFGLWKIGENHAQHMLAMNPKAYNHLVMADFNAGYDLFIARREALGKISTKANGNWSPYTKWASTPTGVNAIRAIIQNAGATPIATVLGAIKARATTDNTRVSSNRDVRTTSFYAALSAMDVGDLVSMRGVPVLMDGIIL